LSETARKWLARYRAAGPAGLLDHSSRPHHSPRRTDPLRGQAANIRIMLLDCPASAKPILAIALGLRCAQSGCKLLFLSALELARRMNNATVINIKGDSCRLKEKRLPGLFPPISTTPAKGSSSKL
jgi:hypothetical protein